MVTKCDICKKEIEEKYRSGWTTVRFAYDHYEFCKDCNVPLVEFLKNHNIIKEEKKEI